MEKLVRRHHDGNALFDLEGIEAVYEVYNPTLTSNFVSGHTLLEKRIQNDPTVFAKKDWKNYNDKDQREIVSNQFRKLVQRFEWNDLAPTAPILSVIHGTSTGIGWKIIETGFASLASLDAGWYGAGMYFTSSIRYAAPYFMSNSNPAVLICLINPGNPYPVTEPQAGANTLSGVPVKPGYQSNFVLTASSGLVQSDFSQSETFDEFVIPQEAQVVPIYLLELSRLRLKGMSDHLKSSASAFKPKKNSNTATKIEGADQDAEAPQPKSRLATLSESHGGPPSPMPALGPFNATPQGSTSFGGSAIVNVPYTSL